MKTALATLIVLSTLGCSHFNKEGHRVLHSERQWARSTFKERLYVGPKRNHLMKPLIWNGMIFQGNGKDGIVAYKQSNGHPIWRYDVESGVQGAVAQGNKLYFGGGDGHLYCVQAYTGKLIWKTHLGAEVIAPVTFKANTVYALTGNNVVHAIHSESGDKKWIYSRKDTTTISVNGGAQPVVHKNRVIAGFSDGFLVAIRVSDGTLIWERLLNLGAKFKDIDSTPVIVDEKIYIGGYDGEFYSLNANNGQIVWQIPKGGYSTPYIEGRNLFLSTSDGEFLSIDKATGKTNWTYKLKKGVATAPVRFKESIVFAQSDGPLVGLEARTGKKLFAYDPGRGAVAPVTKDAEDKTLYLMSNEGNLHAIKVYWKRPQEEL